MEYVLALVAVIALSVAGYSLGYTESRKRYVTGYADGYLDGYRACAAYVEKKLEENIVDGLKKPPSPV